MDVVFSEYAKAELDDAAYFYELEYTGLGKAWRNDEKNKKYIYEKFKSFAP